MILYIALIFCFYWFSDGLWYPFDKVMYGFLIITFNVFLLVLLITILFNYIFNIPISLGYFGINLSLKQRNRTIFSNSSNRNVQNGSGEEHNREAQAVSHNQNNEDRISGMNLQRVLDICAKALNSAHVQATTENQTSSSSSHIVLRRSASAGRLQDTNIHVPAITDLRKRKSAMQVDGGGDAR